MIIAYTNNDEKVVETWIFLDFTTVSCYYHKQSEQSVHEGVHHSGRPCKNKKRLFFKQNLMFWISFTPFLHQIRNPLYDI